MFIHEAVCKAQLNDCCIRRADWSHGCELQPLDGNYLCYLSKGRVVIGKGGRPKLFHPSAADLIADDWDLVPKDCGMYIHEAAAQALAQGRRIRRFYGEGWKYFLIRPTDTEDYCLMESTAWARRTKGTRKNVLSPRWNPSTDDLMANDWEVVD